MSDNTYRQIVSDMVATGHDAGRPKHDVREEIIHMVESAQEADEPWAFDVVARWMREGADRDYTDAHKALNSVTYIRADGRRVRKTASYSRPIRSVESGQIIGQQMQAWWGMSRAALYELRADVAEQHERLADVTAALDLLIEAMDQHPECGTARDAWEAAGHSVDEIDLGEVA